MYKYQSKCTKVVVDLDYDVEEDDDAAFELCGF